MKRKNLERAVLLTVMLMSLHGAAYAENPVKADGTQETITTTTGQDSTILINDTTQVGLTAVNGGSVTVDGNGKLIIDKNAGGDAISIGADSFSDQNVSSGSLIIKDNTHLEIDMDAQTSGTTNYDGMNGLYLTGNNSKVELGSGGLSINMTVKDGTGDWIRGVNQEGGIFTANGFVDIKMSAENNNLYISGIDLRKNYDESKLYLNNGANIEVTGNGNATASAVGIYSLTGAELSATDKVTLNVKDAKVNNGIIVGSTDNSKENLHLKDLEATVSGGEESYGMQAHGGVAVLENANITVKDGTVKNTGIGTWSKGSYTGQAKLGNGIITVEGGNAAYGLIAQQKSSIETNGIVTITAQNAAKNYGVNANGGTIETNGANTTITAQNGDSAYGVYIVDGVFNSKNTLNVYASNATNSNYGIYAYAGKVNVDDVTVITSGDKTTYGIVARDYNNVASEITLQGNATIESDIAARANGKDCYVTFENGLIAGNVAATQLQAMGGGIVTVNSSGNGVVQYNGVTHMEMGNGSSVDMNLNNNESYWNLTGNSEMRDFNIANNALLDMTKDSGANSILYVTGEMKGDNGIIKMDVDATEAANNDSLIVAGTHSGTHYINLNVINGSENSDAVVGKVLVNVANETGEFKANDVEGALYWNSFELEAVESEVVGYDKDWKISAVNQKADATTSVDTILGANALNYHTWRAENDQLMRRMGELRANGADEQGAWFRVHGSKISHDDIAGFENQYTSYELGYDQVTKQTEDVTRYTGAALSYTDGSSSYDSGSGENHSKALSFYNTDIYKSGHYLDLVFKYANMDNDFSVYDTAGQNITGEYKNNGISVSAEYGRKNDLNGGWYIEPQAQLTLGYFTGDDYETSNGIGVDQSGIASVLGRVGFNIGKELGDSGVVYARASLLHEFAGDYDITMTDTASGMSRKEDGSFGDTWVEYGIGAALKTGKNNHLYFDLAKAEGSDFDRDWMWNAGMRWTF